MYAETKGRYQRGVFPSLADGGRGSMGEPVGRVPPGESFPAHFNGHIFILVKKMGRLFDGATRPVQGVQAQIAECIDTVS